MMRWPWSKRTAPAAPEERAFEISISDPAFAEFLNLGAPNYSGVEVNEHSALAVPAIWRAVNLIASTIASMPARTVVDNDDGTVERMRSWLDDPGGPDGPTAYEFWETVVLHLLLYGNAFLIELRNAAGAMYGLLPVHPLAVSIEYDPFTRMKTFVVTLQDGRPARLTENELLHIPGLSTDGIRGLTPIAVARNSIGTAVAGDRAAARTYSSGMLVSGIVTPEDDLEGDEAEEIKRSLDASLTGWENAGGVAVVNRRLKFSPWQMTARDAQFIEGRQFQIEEIARWFGIPPYELMQTEKQTSWGTGIEAQQRGLSRQVIGPWARRIEARVSRLLPGGRRLSFDFSGLEKPTPAEETDLLLKKVQGGIMTVNEARAVLEMAPVDGGDVLIPMNRPNVGGDGQGQEDDDPVVEEQAA